MTKYYKIGKFAASFGLKGEIVLQHNLGKKTALKGLKKIFIETAVDNFLPYFIEGTTIKNHQEVFIKLEDINTMEAARKLTPKEVWLSQDDFNNQSAANAAISMLGYLLIHQQQTVGEIIEVIEQPHQILVAVLINGKEALIPIHEASLEKIDHKNKKVFVQIPDGLLDVYS